jgi:hypothetical protein
VTEKETDDCRPVVFCPYIFTANERCCGGHCQVRRGVALLYRACRAYRDKDFPGVSTSAVVAIFICVMLAETSVNIAVQGLTSRGESTKCSTGTKG